MATAMFPNGNGSIPGFTEKAMAGKMKANVK